MDAADRIRRLEAALPLSGLHAGTSFRLTPQAIALPPSALRQLDGLGRRLLQFQKTCDLLYRQSVRGRAPSWIADWLDAGKPADLVAFARSRPLQGRLPHVIRPDLLLTESGWVLAEIDSIPGGIGLTAWLQENFSAMGEPVIGGPSGMRRAFQHLLPKGPVVLAEEAEPYRPEWEWLVGSARIVRVEAVSDWSQPTYRFFEAFEWESIPSLRNDLDPAHPLTPPLKPFLEEKLWLALFWMPSLREFWRRELGDRYFRDLRQIIPQSWVVEPSSLPPTAVLPGLEVNSWQEVGRFSRKERNLVLKISGYSPLAWGSRSVIVGSDVGNEEWAKAIDHALQEFPRQPWIVQRFHKAASFHHPYWDPGKKSLVSMEGRARVCPYYFVEGSHVHLAGALVTFCPEDKKLLHGMADAILAPARGA
ncbi:MAG: hypothetical protein OHK005_03310 [Candidatus Methylacidiphilales bacterium]